MLQSTRADSPFCEGVEVGFADLSLTGSCYRKILSEVVDFVIEVEGVKPDDFTMASTSKKFRKGGEFNGSYSRAQGSGGHPTRPIQSSLQTVAGGPPQTGQHFSEFGGYPQTPSFSLRPILESESVMDVERLDILKGIFQNRVTDPQ